MKKKQNTSTVETKKKHIYIRKPQLWIEGHLDDYFKVVPNKLYKNNLIDKGK